MTTASALDTCLSIARIIADARRFMKWSTLEACVCRKLANSSTLCIFVRSSHKECGDHCGNAQPLEVWTIECLPYLASGSMEIDGFFLASAVRSQLHFSPLQSWLSRDLLPAGVELITSIVNSETVEKTLELLPDLHRFPPTRSIDGLQCFVSVRSVQGAIMPKPFEMCSLLIETTLTGSSSNTPTGSPIDAPVFPLALGLQNLSLDNTIFKQKCVTPQNNGVIDRKMKAFKPEEHFENRMVARPDSLALATTPIERATEKDEKSHSSEARRILFSDVLDATSPRPLPSPFGRLLQVEHSKESMHSQSEEAANGVANGDLRVSRSAQRSPFFNRMGLPIYSSPAPPIELKRRKVRNSICLDGGEGGENKETIRLATSAPTSRSLLCNFEESALHCRLDPLAEVHGFTGHLVASNGAIPLVDLRLPVRTFFFDNGNDAAPSPYLGVCSLNEISKRGLIIPPAGTLQFTLLNPQGTVVRMFVQRYDFTDLRPAALTFLRQRTFFMREDNDSEENRKLLRYLIHFKLRTDKSGRLRLHNDLRMLFAPNNTIDALNIEPVNGGPYVFRSFTETPRLPKNSTSENP